jgi:diguanylate cyclase (GGDEF)-like protein
MIFLAVIGALRLLTLWNYLRRDHSNDDLSTTRRWEREYLIGATLMSVVLGYNCYYALTHTMNAAVLMGCVSFNVALASGYVARNAAYPAFVIVQIFLFAGPIGVGLGVSDDPSFRALSWFFGVYIASKISVLFSVYRNLVALARTKREAECLATQLHRQNLTLDAAINSMPHGMAMFDDALSLCVANQRHMELYRLDRGSDLQTLEKMAKEKRRDGLVTPEQAHVMVGAGKESIAEQRATQIEIETLKGAELVVGFNPVPDGGVLMTTEDATARKRAEREVERLARYDTLTGLPNRHEFRTRLTKAVATLAEGGPRFAVSFLDLDGFKRINDTLGHEYGDALLVEVSRRLTSLGVPDMIAGRLGGDEFAVLSHASDQAAALSICHEIAAALKEVFDIHGKRVRISASIGVVLADDAGESPEMLLRHADIAQYRAKASGAGVVALFDESMAEELSDRLALEVDLQEAIAAEALEMHYQPIVELASGRIVSYEGLLRWRHPTRGHLPPSVFIPLAEQTGQIIELGRLAIRIACADAVQWPANVGVAINVSLIQFRDPAVLIDCVKESLAKNALDPARLVLEITESSLIEEEEATICTINELRALGVRFAMDDFGVGYSSLSHLGALPFSVVKIDGSLAKNVATSQNAFAIIEAVCALAKRLQMDVVVEGVETVEQQIAIRLAGASRVQGWLVGRPAPASRIAPQERIAAVA